MAFERKWPRIGPIALTQDGTVNGEVYLSSTSGFKAKQEVILRSSAQSNLRLEVKRVLSDTLLLVGEKGRPIDVYSDISTFLVADGANLEAPEQNRPAIPDKEFERAVYEEEPTVAKRVVLVDEFGDRITQNNPLPTSATLVAPSISVDLDSLTPSTMPDPDNVLITGSEDGQKDGIKRAFVNNLRLQILAAHDRIQEIEYADFGTKNQRVTRIDYSSPTFPGIVARKDLVYSLVGNRYRRDDIIWSII